MLFRQPRNFDVTAALVTDLHFGVRNDSEAFRRNQRRFYDELFFPMIRERKADEIVVLGDVFDKRRGINFASLTACREFFFEPLKAHLADGSNRRCRIIVGNHDSYYRDRLDINAIRLLVGKHDGIDVVEAPLAGTEVDGRKAVMLPWICQANEKRMMEIVAAADSETVLFAHLELKGFEMAKGFMMKEGMNASVFGRFKSVYSGHYHQPSYEGNIRYLGSPYEMTWADAGSDRGFWFYEGGADAVEYVPNPYRMFHVFDLETKGAGFDHENVREGNIVRVVVGDDISILDKAVAAFEALGAKTEVVQRGELKHTEGMDVDLSEVEDTRQILVKKIQSLELTNDNRENLLSLFNELYEKI